MSEIFHNHPYGNFPLLPNAAGNALDFSDVIHVHKFGFLDDADTGSLPESVTDLNGLHPGLQTAGVVTMVSTSTDDDGSPLGTGAQTTEFQGLDTNWDLQSETLTTDGTTGVVTPVNQYISVHRAKNLTAGSTGSNVGTQTFSIGGTDVAAISPTRNQTLMAWYATPRNYIPYLLGFDVSIGKATSAFSEVCMMVTPFGQPKTVKDIFAVHSGGAPTTLRPPVAVEFTEKSIFEFQVNTISSNNSSVSATFDLLLVRYT